MSGTRADAWRTMALDPPRAHGAPVGRAALKVTPEDFVVTERLGFEADGGAGHVLLRVRKRGIDTLRLVRLLAREGGVSPRDVGFAGLKDRQAVASQWFTLPARRPAAEWRGVAGDAFAVEEALPHSRKLRRGALRGNGFRITLRGVSAPRAALEERAAQLAAVGVPNYFGPQRFGFGGANIDAVIAFAADGRLPPGREPRGFVYSAARSLIFNAVLAERVRAGTWNRLLDGEFVNLAGRHSWFVAQQIDATLHERLGRYDIHPTGPLAGRGEGPSGEAGGVEAAVLAGFSDLVTRLAEAGVETGRRATRLVPEGLTLTFEGDDLCCEFALPAGSYATVLLRELVDTDPLPGEAGDD